eukprot:1580425-Prymnesium_polylepis.2
MRQGATARRGAVVVTGAGSGVGRDAALELARRGHHVFCGVTSGGSAEALAAEAARALGESEAAGRRGRTHGHAHSRSPWRAYTHPAEPPALILVPRTRCAD